MESRSHGGFAHAIHPSPRHRPLHPFLIKFFFSLLLPPSAHVRMYTGTRKYTHTHTNLDRGRIAERSFVHCPSLARRTLAIEKSDKQVPFKLDLSFSPPVHRRARRSLAFSRGPHNAHQTLRDRETEGDAFYRTESAMKKQRKPLRFLLFRLHLSVSRIFGWERVAVLGSPDGLYF